MILDHIENLSLPDGPKYFNEVRTLKSLAVGLAYLNNQIAAIEQKVRESISKNVRPCSCGNDPRPKWAPPLDLIVCAFHWYAVSACNYVRLVGWLGQQVCSNRPAPIDYTKDVIPVVVTYRNKVAAHPARVFPKDDNAATLDASVLYSVKFSDVAFYAGCWKITKTSKGVSSTSPDICWSLTKTHVELVKRYWPKTGSR